jgi:hypothetical protein
MLKFIITFILNIRIIALIKKNLINLIMGLDLNLFRTERGGNPDTVKESCKKRYQDPVIVDKIIEKD